jgi:hypothetical protein
MIAAIPNETIKNKQKGDCSQPKAKSTLDHGCEASNMARQGLMAMAIVLQEIPPKFSPANPDATTSPKAIQITSVNTVSASA